MTAAPKIDTQAPDRVWLDVGTFNGAVGFAHSKQHHAGEWKPYVTEDVADARAAAAAQAMREALQRAEHASDYYAHSDDDAGTLRYAHESTARLCRAALAAAPDPAALDRLIAEARREAVEAEREACAQIADEHVARYQALLDNAKLSKYMTHYGRLADAVKGVADDIRAARGSKEGRDGA